jgi:hypothetical protein
MQLLTVSNLEAFSHHENFDISKVDEEQEKSLRGNRQGRFKR